MCLVRSRWRLSAGRSRGGRACAAAPSAHPLPKPTRVWYSASSASRRRLAFGKRWRGTMLNAGDWYNVFLSVLANAIWTIFIFLVIAIVPFVSYMRRTRILGFFGVNSTRHLVSIFVSNLLIKPSGTIALENTARGYYGPALSKIEYEAALKLEGLLSAKPLAILPETLLEWLGSNHFPNQISTGGHQA